jgi:hypothetical protein
MFAFYVLVLLGVVALWFLLSFLFKPLGRFFYRLWSDTAEIMCEDDSTNKKE